MQASLLPGNRHKSIEESSKLSISTGKPEILVLCIDEHDRSVEHLGILTLGMDEQLSCYIRAKRGSLGIHRALDDHPPKILPLPIRLQVRIAQQGLAMEENLKLLLFQGTLHMSDPHRVQRLLAQQLVGCCRPRCLNNRIFEQLSHTLL